MLGMTWLDFTVLVLASFRLTHLIVYDEIASFLRNPFLTVSYESDPSGQVLRVVDVKGSGIRRWIGQLLSCHWCVGIWAALAVVAFYLYVPAGFPILVLLAIAGAAAVIETKTYGG